jgi:hypothetical protein
MEVGLVIYQYSQCLKIAVSLQQSKHGQTVRRNLLKRTKPCAKYKTQLNNPDITTPRTPRICLSTKLPMLLPIL